MTTEPAELTCRECAYVSICGLTITVTTNRGLPLNTVSHWLLFEGTGEGFTYQSQTPPQLQVKADQSETSLYLLSPVVGPGPCFPKPQPTSSVRSTPRGASSTCPESMTHTTWLTWRWSSNATASGSGRSPNTSRRCSLSVTYCRATRRSFLVRTSEWKPLKPQLSAVYF